MSKLTTAVLAVALAAPFGLAIHDDLTTDRSGLDLYGLAQEESQWGTSSTLGFAADPDSVEEEDLGALDLAGEADLEDDSEVNAQVPSLSEESLRKLLGSAPASMGPELAMLRFGMSRDEIEAKASSVLAFEERADDLSRVNVWLETAARGGTALSAVRLDIPDGGGVLEELLSGWGDPAIVGQDSRPDIWVNRETGVRAAALPAMGGVVTITFSSVMTPEAMIAPADKRFGFEGKKSLLGLSLDDLRAEYPSAQVDPYYEEYATLDTPGLSCDADASPLQQVDIKIRDRRVVELRWMIPCGGEEVAGILNALSAKFGGPAQCESGVCTFGKVSKTTASLIPGEDGIPASVMVTLPQ